MPDPTPSEMRAIEALKVMMTATFDLGGAANGARAAMYGFRRTAQVAGLGENEESDDA